MRGRDPCTVYRQKTPLNTRVLLFLRTPTGQLGEGYDGSQLRITVRAEDAPWRGSARLELDPGDGSACSCSGLFAEVAMRPVPSPPG